MKNKLQRTLWFSFVTLSLGLALFFGARFITHAQEQGQDQSRQLPSHRDPTNDPDNSDEPLTKRAEWHDGDAFIRSGHLCGTQDRDERTNREINEELNRFKEEELMKLKAENPDATPQMLLSQPGSVTISVYFHVLHQGAGLNMGNIPNSLIQDQIAVLNGAFVNTPFRFQLVSVDRTRNFGWNRMTPGSGFERDAKSRLHQGGAAALNIYSANPDPVITPDGAITTMLGWSSDPTRFSIDPIMDGVVVAFWTLPGVSTGMLGDTLVHEVGHWLGLNHTFLGGCSPLNDGVDDTPAERDANRGCPTNGRDTCTGPEFPGRDPINNYMDYSPDACAYEFTTGQITRMDAVWRQLRQGR